VQREAALLFLYQLVYRKSGLRNVMHGSDSDRASRIARAAVEADARAERTFLDRSLGGWRKATDALALEAAELVWFVNEPVLSPTWGRRSSPTRPSIRQSRRSSRSRRRQALACLERLAHLASAGESARGRLALELGGRRSTPAVRGWGATSKPLTLAGDSEAGDAVLLEALRERRQ
jgi:hypothetical protein